MAKRIVDKDVEEYLRRLECGDISEDDLEDNEDDIDYYTDANDIIHDLEDQENDDDEDPPLVVDNQNSPTSVTVQENEESPPTPLPQSFSTPNNLTGNLCTRNLVWKRKNLDLVQEAFAFKGNTVYPQHIMDLTTPFQFFTYFFEDDLLKSIEQESNRYAIQTNPNFTDTVTLLDLRKFIGILIYTSVYHYPNVRSYWSPKVRFAPIADTMTVNRFEKIRQILHMNDNESHLPVSDPNHDRLHKIRPLINYLNKRFMSVPFDHRLSLDEQMCATKISHFIKQYLPNKPHKWGFKLFVLCCLMGYAYGFEVYSGAQNPARLPNEPDLGIVSNTVIRLLRPVPKKVNHIIYFDNYYTNVPLLYYLWTEGIFGLGTVQRNRLGKSCKLPEKKDVMKADVPRGSYCENVTTYEGLDLAATSWKDNKQVLLLSTYVGSQPTENIDRFDKKQKRTVQISCPRVVKEYNAHMGGVDLMDSYLGRYRIRMKSRKWTTRLFYHLLDMSVINAWVLYKKVLTRKGENVRHILNLCEFRTELAESLCKYQVPVYENKRGRPSFSRLEETAPKKARTARANEQTMPPTDIRFDDVGHQKQYVDKRNKCKYNNCRKLTSVLCGKCRVSLCDNRNNNCFDLFHKI